MKVIILHVFRGYYVSVLQKLTGYRQIPCQEWVSGIPDRGFADTLILKH